MPSSQPWLPSPSSWPWKAEAWRASWSRRSEWTSPARPLREEEGGKRPQDKKEKEIPPEVAFSWPSSRSHALSLGKLKSDCQLCAHSFITSSVTVPFPLISAELLNNNTKLLSFSRKVYKSPALTVKSFQTCNPVLLARCYFDQVLHKRDITAVDICSNWQANRCSRPCDQSSLKAQHYWICNNLFQLFHTFLRRKFEKHFFSAYFKSHGELII